LRISTNSRFPKPRPKPKPAETVLKNPRPQNPRLKNQALKIPDPNPRPTPPNRPQPGSPHSKKHDLLSPGMSGQIAPGLIRKYCAFPFWKTRRLVPQPRAGEFHRRRPPPTRRQNLQTRHAPSCSPLFRQFVQMWKICQAPTSNSKVMTPDLQALTTQPARRYLAGFISKLGILIIGSKRKGLAPARLFYFKRGPPTARLREQTGCPILFARSVSNEGEIVPQHPRICSRREYQ